MAHPATDGCESRFVASVPLLSVTGLRPLRPVEVVQKSCLATWLWPPKTGRQVAVAYKYLPVPMRRDGRRGEGKGMHEPRDPFRPMWSTGSLCQTETSALLLGGMLG